MQTLLAQIALTEVNHDVMRNITSIRVSQDLFDDLSDTPDDWTLAQAIEAEIKPPLYQSATPAIHRLPLHPLATIAFF